jgi:hypothetical protein
MGSRSATDADTVRASARARWRRWLAVVTFALLASRADAADWGGIVPGETTQTAVSGRYGAPSRTETQKVENYDTARWIFEGERAPVGVSRLTVEFGLVTPTGFRADLVRDFRLEPRAGVFTRRVVLNGWGAPARVGKDGDKEIFVYQEGLVVYFDENGWQVELMLFTPPQRSLPESAPQGR